jgi:squalene-hopene/tetraprenyl-beta-curcumene cyclase
MTRTVAAILMTACVLAVVPTLAQAQTKANLPAVNRAIDKALTWLASQRDAKGTWRSEYGPGITGLVLTAYLRHPQSKYTADSPNVRRALDWIVSLQNPDGSIYDPKGQLPLPNYSTSTSLMALSAARHARYAAVIKKAQDFLIKSQVDEGEGATPEDSNYGGIGYGSNPKRNDLSNLSMALTALKDSGVPKDAAVWGKAVRFLNRLQNNSETNDESWAGDDGGFIYGIGKGEPPESKAGEDAQGRPRSYATMTYAGVMSMIYANVSSADPRVKAAMTWLGQHWNLEENEPIGKQGLYYGYHTMAKALAAVGSATFTTSDGRKLDWYKELTDKLLSLQTPAGNWPPNDADRWYEGDPVLVTAYCVLALEAGYPKRR